MSVENLTWMLVKALQINFFSLAVVLIPRYACGVRVVEWKSKFPSSSSSMCNNVFEMIKKFPAYWCDCRNCRKIPRNRVSRWPLTLTVHSIAANVKFNWRWKIRTTLLVAVFGISQSCSSHVWAKRKVWLSLFASLELRNMQILLCNFFLLLPISSLSFFDFANYFTS